MRKGHYYFTAMIISLSVFLKFTRKYVMFFPWSKNHCKMLDNVEMPGLN